MTDSTQPGGAAARRRRSEGELRRRGRGCGRRPSASYEGTVLGLIGPNGAGKTSMIDALTGYTESGGQVVFGGRDISRLRPYRRARLGLARTFQSVELFDDLTVDENLLVASEHVTVASALRDLFLAAPRPEPHRRGLGDLGVRARGRRRSLSLRDLARQAQARRRRPRARPATAARPARRAGCRTRHRGEPRARASPSDPAGGARRDRLPHRPRHGARAQRLRPPHGPRLRTTDRHRAPRRRSARTRASSRPTWERTMQPPSPTASGDALVLADVVAGYQGIPVVRDLNLKVRAGEVVALLGPNGAGKTTTLETIAGLNRPISRLDPGFGRGRRPARRHTSSPAGGSRSCPRAAPCFPASPSASTCAWRAGATAHARTSCSRCSPSCGKCMHRKAGLLSGGEQQMLAIGRALVTRPQAAARRRDEPRAGSGDRRAAAARSSGAWPTSSERACCSSSSTSRSRSRSPIAPTS